MRSFRSALIASLVFTSTSVMAQVVVEPGGIPADQTMALTNPDEYAWRLFFFINRPAKSGTAGIADENRKFGDVAGNVSMVWETWALAAGRAASEVYRPDGSRRSQKLDFGCGCFDSGASGTSTGRGAGSSGSSGGGDAGAKPRRTSSRKPSSRIYPAPCTKCSGKGRQILLRRADLPGPRKS